MNVQATIKATLKAEQGKAEHALLSFGKGNAKLGKAVLTFSLPAGYTCPGAQDCLALADRTTGHITDGPSTAFRCFSASAEAVYPSTREARWRNYRALETAARGSKDAAEGMAALILASLPVKAVAVRIHVSGDFYRPAYLAAWLHVAVARPATRFYAYTKSLSLFAGVALPSNVRITASLGGKQDGLAAVQGIRTARVVYSEAEAAEAGLQIDHDDSHAWGDGGDFALLIHGVQPKGGPAAKALSALRVQGWTGYSA